jgi:sulfate/thiosulfate transport system ATP-binding protein
VRQATERDIRTLAIELTDIAKQFGTFRALRGVSLTVEDGEFIALLGPSGSGKTTLLRILAGLDFPDSGTLRFGGESVDHVSVRERQVGFVFQHYALFRHMTVFENVAFGLRVKPRAERPDEAEIRRRVLELLRLVQLEPQGHRYPSQLSGGQRQRVALARALAIEPRFLLLDEPFGALDAKVRKELRRWLRRLHDDMGLTSVFVTHDQEEALELADRVVVMSEGRIEQVGTPRAVYDDPATPFVYEFLGNANRLDCRISGGTIEIAGTRLSLHQAAGVADGPGIAFVRPHDLAIDGTASASHIAATVRHQAVNGPVLRIELELTATGQTIEAESVRHAGEASGLKTGQRVGLMPRQIKVFAASAQR